MASHSKRRRASSKKNMAHNGGSLQVKDFPREMSPNLGLLTASETFEGVGEFTEEIIEESFDTSNEDSAMFDVVQTQLDSQLQNQLDFHVTQQRGLEVHEDEAQSSKHDDSDRQRKKKPSLFTLPKDGAIEKKPARKHKHPAENVDAVLLGKAQKIEKKKRKAKSTINIPQLG